MSAEASSVSVPRLTIGLVVRNGAAHLSSAIESLERQTCQDFQICAFDNASTDSTPEILQGCLNRRLIRRIVRHTHNIGWLRNFIGAVEAADTEFFCWATHDDLHHPAFIETLLLALDRQPSAALACCDVQNMDPDGTLGDVRPETRSLHTTAGMTSAARLQMYLREGAGTPFYGIFRTPALMDALNLLQRIDAYPGPTTIGVDMMLIASIVRDHDIIVCHDPLLLFRRGGWSHQIDLYRTLPAYLRQLWRFQHLLRAATRSSSHSTLESLGVTIARWRFILRYLASAPMRRMTWHYLGVTWKWLPRALAKLQVRLDANLHRLQSRVAMLPAGSRIALFGAGKHTVRCLPQIRLAAGHSAMIVGAIDDDDTAAATRCTDLRVVQLNRWQDLRPDLVIISSDSYEAALYRRARHALPRDLPIWCIYNPALETTWVEASAASTSAMNADISAGPSTLRLNECPGSRAA